MKQTRFQSILKKTYIALLLVIFGGIVLHAPISIGFGVLFPNLSLLIKSWKEILMIIAGLIAIYFLIKNRQLRLLKDPITILSAIYILLHLILLPFFGDSLNSKLAGLIIDLRYIFFFCLVYVALKMWLGYKKLFLRVGLIGAVIVIVFGLMQVFILPKDILKYIGYSVNTISPYMTVDQNPDFIRINSTLRGPNPLGAYIIVILAVIVSYFCKFKLKIDDKLKYLLTSLFFGGLVVLWFTYSRSAIVAAIISIALVVLVFFSGKKLSKKLPLVIIAAILATFAGLIIAFNNNYLISNVLLHQNPNDGTSVNSNDNHLSSIQTGLTLALIQPFGAGVGSTGSASLFGSSPIIIENQYLFIAHETGWIGLILFIGIFGLLMFGLWQNRKDWLTLGVFASGAGLALVGLLLPVWVDDTVSIVWWGLAAIALIKQK